MQILVCLKAVPEKDSRFKIDESGVFLQEEGLSFETNESDLYALEEALQVKEKRGGEVIALSLGGEKALKTLKNALATGADRAIHVQDGAFRGSDAYVIARSLARVVQREGIDLVLTGVQSDDLAFGQTGILLAHFLGWSHATIVVALELDDEGRIARVRRELESNLLEDVEINLPAVISVQSGINQPRYATLKGIMQAKKKDIKAFTGADLGFGPAEIGEAGAKVHHLQITIPGKKKKTVLLTGTAEEAARALVEKLRLEAKVL